MSIINETLYVVTPDSLERWYLTKEKINADPQLAEAFSAGLVRKCPRCTLIGGDYGFAGVAMSGNYEVWSVRVLLLPLEAPYTLIEGVHTPEFDGHSLPVLPMKWTPPSTMSLVLGISVFFEQGKQKYYTGDHHLVAFDAQGRMWRLPLSNVYNDCKLCHGQDPHYTDTTLETVKLACERFSKSRWNSDLYQVAGRVQTRNMFRFKPTADGFEQLPPVIVEGKDWTSLCEKVAVEKITSVIQPV